MSALLGLVGRRFVTVVEPEAGPWLRAEAPQRALPLDVRRLAQIFEEFVRRTAATDEVPA